MINNIISGQLITNEKGVKWWATSFCPRLCFFHLSNELQEFKHNGILSFTQNWRCHYSVQSIVILPGWWVFAITFFALSTAFGYIIQSSYWAHQYWRVLIILAKRYDGSSWLTVRVDMCQVYPRMSFVVVFRSILIAICLNSSCY